MLRLETPVTLDAVRDQILRQDCTEAVPLLPDRCVDLLVLDPPYNLDKRFGARAFRSMPTDAYADWMQQWLQPMLRLLKPTASVYVCADWRSSSAVQSVLGQHLQVQNRITWEREKGRGALVARIQPSDRAAGARCRRPR